MDEEKRVSSRVIILSTVVAITIGGCAPKESCKVAATTKTLDKESTIAIKTTDKDRQIAALNTAIRSAKPSTVIKEFSGESSLFPPNAKAGECYARVLIPAQYDLISQKVLASDSSQKLSVIPAQYKWSEKKILVKEASQRIVPVPATYKTVLKKVLVSPENKKVIDIPAVYEVVIQKVLVTPAHTIWRIGRGPIEKLDNTTGEILCLVNVAAVYKKITKKVLKTPATTKVVVIPAVYKNVKKRVLKTPATTKVIPIASVYKSIRVKELIQPATIKTATIPEKYTTIQKKVLVSNTKLKWQKVLCKSQITTKSIKEIQKALKTAGFNPGPIDGIMGWRTKSALSKFQKSNNLATGALTQATMDKLGI